MAFRTWFSVVALLLVVAARTPVLAEAKVSGTVKDTAGAALPDVTIRLGPVKTGEPTLETTTKKKGQYLFALVRAGEYTLTATVEGQRVSEIDVVQRAAEGRIKLNKQAAVAPGEPLPQLNLEGTDTVVYNLVLAADSSGSGSFGTGVPLLGSGQVVELIQAGDLAKARKEIERALATDPANAAMLYLQAYVEMQAGDADAALRSSDALLAASPGFAGAHLLRGTALEKKGDGDGALAEYRVEAETATDATVQRDAWIRIAMLTNAQGRSEENLAALRKIVEVDPSNVIAHGQLIDRYAQAGDVDALSAILSSAPDEVRADPMVHFNLGAALYNHQKADEAAKAFQTAIDLKPDLADAYKHLGFCKVALADYAGAITAVRRYLELAPQAQDAADMRKLLEGLEKRK
jgi:tetratricopeptide (TPR) repeat protein